MVAIVKAGDVQPRVGRRNRNGDEPGDKFSAIVELLLRNEERQARNEELLIHIAQLLEQRFAPKPKPADFEILSRLLPAIGGKRGSGTFSTKEILQDPALQSRIPELSCRQLGRLFARSCCAKVNGLCLARSIVEDNRVLWFLTRVFNNY